MENKREKYETNRISRLPESVLHHILCFLSQTKAVQTCVLSKSWRHLGPTRPVIELRGACRYNDVGHVSGVCENCFDGNEEAFISVVEKTFERYHEQNLFPHQLDLHMLRADSKSISVLEKWIPIFINAVTTFSLSFKIGPYSNLPLLVFKAEYLRELHLSWCRLNDIDSIGNVLLKNLQKLSLHMVQISNEALEKIISGCPLVKRLVINFCFVNRDIIRPSIAINAPTLESIRIDSCSIWHPNNTNNNYFPHLKSLHLSNVNLPTESFHYFSCNFPRLQELSLLKCSGYEEIDLSSWSIKRLIIHESGRSSLKMVAIEVPNIRYLEFSSNCMPPSLSVTTTSREWKSHLNFDRCVYISDDDVLVVPRILKLFGMVKSLSRSQISLTFYDALYFNTKQWDFIDHPVEVENLGLAISKPCPDSLIHFVNALFRIFRPIYTNAEHVHDNNDKEVTEFIWKTLILEREKTEYGWEQHLEEVSIEASDEKGKVWHRVAWACLPEWSENQKIRFRLKWRD